MRSYAGKSAAVRLAVPYACPRASARAQLLLRRFYAAASGKCPALGVDSPLAGLRVWEVSRVRDRRKFPPDTPGEDFAQD